MESEEYLHTNRDSWNSRTEYHLNSEFYDVKAFLEGKNSLREIELALLGDVKGKKILHLQCHFGQDTLSLARMGAKVTGVDFSDRAIQAAVDLNEKLGLNAEFFCCDIYSLPVCLRETFDLVFTSYGTIGWLPDIRRWAGIVASYLKPGGKFVFAEFHPTLWMFDNDFKTVAYSYFNREPIVEELQGTYADPTAPIKKKSITWNHDLGEVLGNLIEQGLTVEHFSEYDFSPYPCFADMVELEPGRYYLKGMEHKLPMVYALRAIKNQSL